MQFDFAAHIGKGEVSFNYATDNKIRFVRIHTVGPNYIVGEREKNGKVEHRTYNFNKMTNVEAVKPDPFFAPQFRPLQGDENR